MWREEQAEQSPRQTDMSNYRVSAAAMPVNFQSLINASKIAGNRWTLISRST